MAEKISTLILTVDLDCYICSKKIKKILSFKRQAREQILAVNFDEKSNTVTISGPFDPHILKKKLLCKAGKVIKEIKVKEDDKKPPPPQPKPAEPVKPKPALPKEPEKPNVPAQLPVKEKAKPAEPQKENPKPAEPAKEKPKPVAPKETEPEPKKSGPVPEYYPAWPVWPVGPAMPACCWRPVYDEAYGGCRCCSCGMFFGWSPAPPSLPAEQPPFGGGCTVRPSTNFFCEEDPSCIIM